MSAAAPCGAPRLLGDVGGTHARFAWQAGPGAPLTDVDTLACDAHATLAAAMRHYLARHAKTAPREVAFGIATAITGDEIRMLNHPWAFSIKALQHELAVQRLLVLNDFQALAMSLPMLQAADLHQVGGGGAVPGAAMAVIGPGTGLGAATLLPAAAGRRAVTVDGEGGHVTLAPTDALEDAVLGRLRQRFGHASGERALSGPGLQNLYQAVCEVDGVPAKALDAAQICALADAPDEGAPQRSDPQCRQALALFYSLLGTVAGNLALSVGARGGVYLGGGILPRLGERIDRSAFREKFEAKGRLRPYMAAIAVHLIRATVSPALLGAAAALDDA